MSLVNNQVFRYVKYWDNERDAPPTEALAEMVRKDHWEKHVTFDQMCFEKWWYTVCPFVKARINLKRTNQVSQIRNMFKGKGIVLNGFV